MMMDWKDPRLEHEWKFLQIDPHNLDTVRGELTGVALDGCSLSFGYETETRTSAKIKVIESDYIPDSWIRIVDTVPAAGYREEIGTFIVAGISGDTMETGMHTTEYELQSVLWALKEDYSGGHWTIGQGAYALTAIDAVAKLCEKTSRHKAGAYDYILKPEIPKNIVKGNKIQDYDQLATYIQHTYTQLRSGWTWEDHGRAISTAKRARDQLGVRCHL